MHKLWRIQQLMSNLLSIWIVQSSSYMSCPKRSLRALNAFWMSTRVAENSQKIFFAVLSKHHKPCSRMSTSILTTDTLRLLKDCMSPDIPQRPLKVVTSWTHGNRAFCWSFLWHQASGADCLQCQWKLVVPVAIRWGSLLVRSLYLDIGPCYTANNRRQTFQTAARKWYTCIEWYHPCPY